MSTILHKLMSMNVCRVDTIIFSVSDSFFLMFYFRVDFLVVFDYFVSVDDALLQCVVRFVEFFAYR